MDVSRVAAGILAGVGLMGGGLVISGKQGFTSGITTAAGIWATAGIGMAIGAGLYFISVASAGMIIIAQEITHRVSYFAHAACGGNLRLTLVQKEGVIMMMENFLKGYKVEIAAVKIHKNKKDEIKVEFEVVYPPGFDKAGLISHLAENENVVTILE